MECRTKMYVKSVGTRQLNFLLLYVICIVFILSACSTNESETLITEDISKALISQVNPLLDENSDVTEDIELISIRYGSFTHDHANELLAEFRSVSPPHVAGLERTIVAIFSVDTLKVISHKVFAADKVSIYLLPTESGQKYILYLGESTSQGLTTQVLHVLKVNGEMWSEIFTDKVLPDDERHYVFTSDSELLTVKLKTTQSVTNYHEIISSLKWDIEKESFIPIS